MNWNVIIGKLPLEWFRIMTILSHSLTAYPHQRVEMCWHLSRKQLRWTEFLGFLTQLEPLSKVGELVFQPLFYHLPENLQKHTLQFIYQHCDDINLTVLRQFLQSLFEKSCRKVDWINLYLNLLQKRMNCRQNEDEELAECEMQRAEKRHDRFETSLTTETFQFTERSSSQILSVCERLKMASDCGSAWNVVVVGGIFSGSSIEIGAKMEEETEEETKEKTEEEEKTKEEEEEKTKEETKEQELMTRSSASVMSEVNVVGEVVIEECMDVQQEATDISPEKSVTGNDITQIESVIITDHEIPGHAVDFEVQAAVLKLRESWLREETVDPEIVILLKTLSPQQLQTVLSRIESLNLPDTSVLLACQTIVESASQEISHNNVFIFATTFLLPQILRLDQSASRLFAAAVVSFAKAFPLHSIEGLVNPLVASSGLPQSELLMKVIRESYSDQHQPELLQSLLDRSVMTTWSDQMMIVIQSIVDAKVELRSDHLKLLLNSFEQNSSANSSNRMFGKLLLSFLQIHGHLLTTDDLRQFSKIVDLHKTFLTKLMKSTLAKLSADAVTCQ